MTKPENEKAPVAATTRGLPKAVEANDGLPFANDMAAGKPKRAAASGIDDSHGGYTAHKATFRALTGQIWRYRGKRAKVLDMLSCQSGGVTQWDTLPWHTRLGGTIHALREDGLLIETQLEGDFRHARYRLLTPGKLESGDGK